QLFKRIEGDCEDKGSDLKKKEGRLIDSFKEEVDTGNDVVFDFLWGEPKEKLIQTIVAEEISLNGKRIRLVQIGEKAGSTLTLSASALRTSGLEISGGAAGLTPTFIQEGTEI